MNVITNNKGMMLFLENKSDSFNEDTELLINIISNSNVTYEVTFSTKTTNVKATTEDNRKGTVGILEPINN